MKEIIIADDEVVLLTMLGAMLEASGYSVKLFRNAVSAWNYLLTEGGDLLLTDVHMSKMDGSELVEHLLDDPEFADFPVVLMSGDQQTDEIRRLVARSERVCFVEKPFSLDRVKSLLAKLLTPRPISRPQVVLATDSSLIHDRWIMTAAAHDCPRHKRCQECPFYSLENGSVQERLDFVVALTEAETNQYAAQHLSCTRAHRQHLMEHAHVAKTVDGCSPYSSFLE